MNSVFNLKESSFLVYGLGVSGRSVVNFFKKNKIKNFEVWDDKNINLFRNKRTKNLKKSLKDVNYIVLSPGVSLVKSKNGPKLKKFNNKIITDIDLIFLFKKFYKSIVITGTNGKSTTCKIIYHLLQKNKYNALLGGNIGTPVLNLNITKKSFLVIEVSSFQLSHSKFICPDYALMLNITNDHLDWHGKMINYINSKLKIFKLQNKYQYSIINDNFSFLFKKRKFAGKLINPMVKSYQELKFKIRNSYLKSKINDENMSFVFTLSQLLKINRKSFVKSLNNFEGLPHRYEVFLKKNNCIFVNDSKATSFEAAKFALKNTKNIYWIVGGLPKKGDKINLKNIKENIVKCYLIGNHINFFKKQLQKDLNCYSAKNIKNSIIKILKDIKLFKKKDNTILLSPASASFDQYLNFEKRGNDFKKYCRLYARKFI